MKNILYIQAVLVICGLFICKFAYSHLKKWPKMTIFLSKMDFLSANSRFALKNDKTYLRQITRETCTAEKGIFEVKFIERIFFSFSLKHKVENEVHQSHKQNWSL